MQYNLVHVMQKEGGTHTEWPGDRPVNLSRSEVEDIAHGAVRDHA